MKFDFKKTIKLSSLLLSTLFIFTFCDSTDPIIPGGNNNSQPSEVSKGIEVPALKGGSNNLFISHSTILNGTKTLTYCLEYDCTKRQSRWVAFTFYNATAALGSGRTDAWANDPDVPAEYRASRSDFSGYDRGHLCASYDRQYSVEANEQTFYYSNMSPQIGNFNQNIWATLESQVQKWGRNSSFRDTLYVVKGGTIDSPKDILTYTDRGSFPLPVPKYYFMAILCKKGTERKAIAFWLEHKAGYQKPYDFKQYAISIDELEQKTNIDFFVNLPDDIERKVEAELDTSYNTWPGL